MRSFFALASVGVLMGVAATSRADIFHNYENLDEGFLGQSFYMDGVTYHDVNNVSGSYPDGELFGPGDPGSELIIEDATLFFNDFPGYGSADKVMTFGSAFINGDNVSIGALASVWMDLDALGDSASFDIAFYENGPWGTLGHDMVWHLDALMGGSVVASDTYTFANNGGRDNPNWTTLSLGGATFDQLHLYAMWNGVYSAPRGMIDNLAITAAPVPEPATISAIGLGVLALLRRRKTSK